jgi:hypothetical protein
VRMHLEDTVSAMPYLLEVIHRPIVILA